MSVNTLHIKTYKAFGVKNFRKIPQVKKFLTESQCHAIEIVGTVLPFKTNSYVIDELIDWEHISEDPMFQLTFPQREMLSDSLFEEAERIYYSGVSKVDKKKQLDAIRVQLNPHPGGQLELNVPVVDQKQEQGLQHKYDQTVLFFPSHGQTCHAYCTFCFRWPQFVGMKELKFGSNEISSLIAYLHAHPDVTDVLFTGGDPLIMTAARLRSYLDVLLSANIPNLKTIRLGSKALGYWPYRFISDADTKELLSLFSEVVNRGYHLAFMAHFNHSVELSTPAVNMAIKAIQDTGAVIRCQAPIMKHINACADQWADLTTKQIALGCIPYYMFVARDTGAQEYFALPLEQCYHIYIRAMKQVSGISRQLRGPVLSTAIGKLCIIDVLEIQQQRYLVFKNIQSRHTEQTGTVYYYRIQGVEYWPELDRLEEHSAFLKRHLIQMINH